MSFNFFYHLILTHLGSWISGTWRWWFHGLHEPSIHVNHVLPCQQVLEIGKVAKFHLSGYQFFIPPLSNMNQALITPKQGLQSKESQMFCLISRPNMDGILFNMAYFEAVVLHIRIYSKFEYNNEQIFQIRILKRSKFFGRSIEGPRRKDINQKMNRQQWLGTHHHKLSFNSRLGSLDNFPDRHKGPNWKTSSRWKRFEDVTSAL